MTTPSHPNRFNAVGRCPIDIAEIWLEQIAVPARIACVDSNSEPTDVGDGSEGFACDPVHGETVGAGQQGRVLTGQQ